jgi:hypothetical protein
MERRFARPGHVLRITKCLAYASASLLSPSLLSPSLLFPVLVSRMSPGMYHITSKQERGWAIEQTALYENFGNNGCGNP